MTTGFTVTDAGKAWISKDPDATLDYTWDWTAWLAVAVPSDTITQHTIVTAGSTSVTVVSSGVSGGKVTAWISGGVAGEQVSVTCRITTNNNRIDDRTFILRINDR